MSSRSLARIMYGSSDEMRKFDAQPGSVTSLSSATPLAPTSLHELLRKAWEALSRKS